MARHLEREIDRLKERVLALSDEVNTRFRQAVTAIQTRDVALAQGVIDGDDAIDAQEVEIEEECLKLLALHQPVAIDLRFIVTVLKMNNDLERIGDMAANIAERALFLASHPPVEIPFDFAGMAEKVQSMLDRSFHALVNLDTELARQICLDDAAVDAYHREVYQRMEVAMRSHPEDVACYIPLLTIARHLERIADHATNIAEDVLYLVNGEIRRHQNPNRF